MKTNLTEVSKDAGNIKCEVNFSINEWEALNKFKDGYEVFYSVPNDDNDVLVESEEMILEAYMLHYDLFIKKYYR